MDQPRHGGHVIAQALNNEGVRYLFTLSGGHIAPIYDGCVDVGIEVLDFRHEQAAAHAADGWARVTLSLGAAAVTAGPGVTDAVTGIANAYYANLPEDTVNEWRSPPRSDRPSSEPSRLEFPRASTSRWTPR